MFPNAFVLALVEPTSDDPGVQSWFKNFVCELLENVVIDNGSKMVTRLFEDGAKIGPRWSPHGSKNALNFIFLNDVSSKTHYFDYFHYPILPMKGGPKMMPR